MMMPHDYMHSRPKGYGAGQQIDHQLRGQMKELEARVQRLQLLNAALWELIRDNTKLTDAHLEKKMTEIDARDGVADGKVTEVPLKCPACGRVSTSRHWKCLYCGLEFERSVFT